MLRPFENYPFSKIITFAAVKRIENYEDQVFWRGGSHLIRTLLSTNLQNYVFFEETLELKAE